MLSSVGGWLRKRRSTLLWLAGGTAGVYALGVWAKSKVLEMAKRAELQQLSRENLRRRFEQNQLDATLTTLAWLSLIAESVMDAWPVEALTERLRRMRRQVQPAAVGTDKNDDSEGAADTPAPPTPPSDSPRKSATEKPASKQELWEMLRVNSVARTVAAVYTLNLLNVFSRIQLNLLGRFTYLDSVDVLAAATDAAEAANATGAGSADSLAADSSATTISYDTERKYLALQWHFLWVGVPRLLRLVHRVVAAEMTSIALTKPLSPADWHDLWLRVHAAVMQQLMAPGGDDSSSSSSTTVVEFVLLPPAAHLVQTVYAGVTMSGQAPPPSFPPHDESDDIANAASVLPVLDAVPESFKLQDTMLDSLVAETRQCLRNTDFTAVLDKSIQLSLTHLHGRLFAVVSGTKSALNDGGAVGTGNVPVAATTTATENGAEAKPLVSWLPAISREAHHILTGAPNSYLHTVNSRVPELTAFMAVIYCDFGDH